MGVFCAFFIKHFYGIVFCIFEESWDRSVVFEKIWKHFWRIGKTVRGPMVLLFWRTWKLPWGLYVLILKEFSGILVLEFLVSFLRICKNFGRLWCLFWMWKDLGSFLGYVFKQFEKDLEAPSDFFLFLKESWRPQYLEKI